MREELEPWEEIPPSYRPGNKLLYYPLRWLLIFLEFFISPRHTLLGETNLKQVEELRAQGKKIIFDFDHFSAADIPLPLVLFHRRGFGSLSKGIFFLIGLRWGKRFLVKGGDRVFIVPPPLVPSRPHRHEFSDDFSYKLAKEAYRLKVDRIRSYNNFAFEIVAQQLERGMIVWSSSQGTRSRTGKIQKSLPGAERIWENADYLVPIALEGTEKIIPIGAWFPRLWQRMTVLVGQPIPLDKLHPSAEDMGVIRALLHIHDGDPSYAGEYEEAANDVVDDVIFQNRLRGALA